MNTQSTTDQVCRLVNNLARLNVVPSEATDSLLAGINHGLERTYRASRPKSKASVHEEITWKDNFVKRTQTLLTQWGITTNGLLRLCTEQELGDLYEMGAKLVDEARAYLLNRGWGFRSEDTHFAVRAKELYGRIEDTPIDALMARQPNSIRFTISRERWTVLKEDGVTTLGALHARSDDFRTLHQLVGGEDTACWLQGWLAGVFS